MLIGPMFFVGVVSLVVSYFWMKNAGTIERREDGQLYRVLPRNIKYALFLLIGGVALTGGAIWLSFR